MGTLKNELAEILEGILNHETSAISLCEKVETKLARLPENYMKAEDISDVYLQPRAARIYLETLRELKTKLTETKQGVSALADYLRNRISFLEGFDTEEPWGEDHLLGLLLRRLPGNMKAKIISPRLDRYEVEILVNNEALVTCLVPEECPKEEWEKLVDYTIHNARTQAAIIMGDIEWLKNEMDNCDIALGPEE